jgi:hypothetical protein
MIDNFDTDHTVPDDNLGKIIEKYPNVHNQLLQYNKYYHNLCKILYLFFVINWIASAVLVFYYFYLDKSSITVMISNFLLVSQKIHDSYTLSKSSESSPSVSAYLSENLVFNIMDVKKYNNDTTLNLILVG